MIILPPNNLAMQRINFLILIFLDSVIAAPFISTNITSSPITPTIFNPYHSVIRDASSLAQLPPKPWPTDSNKSKTSNVVGTVVGITFAIAILVAGIIYLRWKSRQYGKKKAATVKVVEVSQVTQVTHGSPAAAAGPTTHHGYRLTWGNLTDWYVIGVCGV